MGLGLRLGLGLGLGLVNLRLEMRRRRAVLVAAAHIEGVEVSEKLLPELGRISAAHPACGGERAVGHTQRRRGRPHAHLPRGESSLGS